MAPELPPPPPAVSGLSDRNLRRRATDVWGAVVRMEGLIQVWRQFLGLVHWGNRLSDESDDRLRELYPEVADTGAVLSALVEDKERRIAARRMAGQNPGELAGLTLLHEVDRALQIVRGPNERYRSLDINWV